MADRYRDQDDYNRRRYDEDDDRFEREGSYYGTSYDRDRYSQRYTGRERYGYGGGYGYENPDEDYRQNNPNYWRGPYTDRDYDYDRGYGYQGAGYRNRGNQGQPYRDQYRGNRRGRMGYDYENRAYNRYGRDRDYEENVGRYSRNAEEYGPSERDYGEETNFSPTTWSYTEYWYVPGPFSGVGPKGYEQNDEQIMEEACQRLSQHGQLDASDIEVDVQNGEVILSGTVNDRQAKRRAETTVESVPGVWDVRNNLSIRGRPADLGGNRGKIRPDMEVIGKNGDHIGTVKTVRNRDFLVDRDMARDVYVPFSAAREENNKVKLDVTADQVDKQDWQTSALFGNQKTAMSEKNA